MSILRPNGPFRVLFLVVTFVALATSVSGCGIQERIFGPDGEAGPDVIEEETTYGPCLPTYGREVQSASISRDGSRVLYLSGRKPTSWPDDRGWASTDEAIYVREGSAERYIVTTWDPTDLIPQYATPESADEAPGTRPLEEDMKYAWLSQQGDRFLLATGRVGVKGLFAKLYSGSVPAEGNDELKPGEGLSLVKVNDFAATEGVDGVELSPDGTKVAVTVSSLSELRIYNLDSNELTVYTRGEDGETVIENELPLAPTSLDVSREPAISGISEMVWSPDGTRLALSFETGVGTTALGLLEVASGEVIEVRRFIDSTLPQAVWNTDGRSLFVMTTKLTHGTIFGDTEIRHLAAAEDGREISSGGKLPRPLGFRTEPAWFIGNEDNEHFFFVWDGVAYRLTAPGGEPANASYLPISSDSYTVSGRGVSVSPATERLAFVAVNSRSMVGERLHSLANQCPIGVTPSPEGQEGVEEAGDEAPAEGEEAEEAAVEAEEAAEGEEAEEAAVEAEEAAEGTGEEAAADAEEAAEGAGDEAEAEGEEAAEADEAAEGAGDNAGAEAEGGEGGE